MIKWDKMKWQKDLFQRFFRCFMILYDIFYILYKKIISSFQVIVISLKVSSKSKLVPKFRKSKKREKVQSLFGQPPRKYLSANLHTSFLLNRKWDLVDVCFLSTFDCNHGHWRERKIFLWTLKEGKSNKSMLL